MKKIYIFMFLVPVFSYAADLVCMGNSNTNQLIQVELKLDTRLGKVSIEGNTIFTEGELLLNSNIVEGMVFSSQKNF